MFQIAIFTIPDMMVAAFVFGALGFFLGWSAATEEQKAKREHYE